MIKALIYGLIVALAAHAKTTPTINIVASPSPVGIGQPVSVAVTITGTSGPATGSAKLQVNGNAYGTVESLGPGGTANFSIPGNGVPNPETILFIAAGTCGPGGPAPNTVGVLYGGDSNYLPAIASTCLAVVPVVAVTPNPAVYGQPLMYTATVDSFDTGTVSLFDGATTLTTTAPIVSGQAQFAPPLPVTTGNHSITAAFNGQTSNPVNLAVNKANTTTALSFGQVGITVTFTATVAPVAPGAGTPTGTVQFKNGNAVLGSAPVVNSKAALSASNFAGTITAVYSGDANFNGSSSAGASIDAVQPVAGVSISSSLNPSMLGQAVSFSASVNVTQGNGVPTGSVQFSDGATPLGSGSVSGGGASVTVSCLTVGSHAISAQYSGDSVFAGASASMGQVVNRAVSSLNVNASPAQITSIQSVTVSAQVVGPSPVPPCAGLPTGQITFADGGTSLGSVTISGGAASITVGSLSVGTHQLTASYSGDKNYTASSGSASVLVTLASVKITTTSLGSATVGQFYSASVGATGGTQPYTFSIGGLPPGISADPSGAISGTPTDSGVFSVSVQVIDGKGASDSATLSLTVVALPLTISGSFPDGKQGADYSGGVSVSGGVPPYTVTISGLPPNLTASASGAVSGQPLAAGSSTVTVQATDSKGTSATKQFTFNIAGTSLAITTTALAGGTVGQAYNAGVAAIGGTPPYTWSGSVPPGLSLDPASGAISGTPTVGGPASVSVTVTDKAGAQASASFTVTFAFPAVPMLIFTGIGNTAAPQAQPTFGLALTAPYPADIQGTLTLSFQPITGSDTGEVIFATGGHTVAFTFAANATTAVFPVTPMAFQTGTVAGTITLTATLKSNGIDITPMPAPSKQIQVPAGPPVITNVQATRMSSGFTVAITGYTTTREVTQAVFHFNPAAGSNLQTTDITVPIASLFAPWLQGNQVIGSQFLFTQQFTVQGDTQAIASVTVTLANMQGVSQPATATLQ